MVKRSTRISVAWLLTMLILVGAAWGDGRQTVLFDQGHGQKFVIESTGELQLAGLAEIFRDQGFRVTGRSEPISDTVLAGVDVLVLSGPFRPYTAEEVTAICDFIGRGGRLAVMLHFSQPLTQLLTELRVGVSPGVIHDPNHAIDGKPLNFRVTRFVPHRLCAGLDHFSLYGAWGVTNMGNNAAVIAFTNPGAWIDPDDNRQIPAADSGWQYGVAVAGQYGLGRFVVFGDDALFQNHFLDGDNRLLARNLADWLK